ncbi:conserved hypothetical protein [Candidatus Desulfosporosinus infrequens]|uniref:Uncharacterized protein n=1 Tax=Candidatus Desulfosporosinus infrequens TaxID=2043169 RepID=A0A2U3KB27_9FIRM|nr:conserved hypothetical protein [Candidatus Desulfosporosinus infrequens]
MNQWGRQPTRKDSRTLVIGIVILSIIGYLLLPNLYKTLNISSDPVVTATNLNNVNPSSPYEPNDLNSSGYPTQNFLSDNNTSNSDNRNSQLTTGYWILFLSNGTFQQFSVNAQVYAFLQELIQSDRKGTAAITVFLVDNGQIRQHIVSNETYAVISNIATINARASNNSTYSPPPQTTMPPNTVINETMTINNLSTTGFIVALNPALNGLVASNFTLHNSLGNPVVITGASSSDNGASYVISVVMSAGQTYTLTVADAGYTFGAVQNIVIPQ